MVLFIKVPPHGQDFSPLAKGTSPSRVPDGPLLYALGMSHGRVWLQGQEFGSVWRGEPGWQLSGHRPGLTLLLLKGLCLVVVLFIPPDTCACVCS